MTRSEEFIAYVQCAGCGESFAVHSRRALARTKWCSERCRRAQYAGTCADCGAPTNGAEGRGPHAPRRCRRCAARVSSARRSLELRTLVEAMWADGYTAREIAAMAGWNVKRAGTAIASCRARGYDLPHRRTPEQLERMTAGAAERLAKARAVYRQSRAAA